MQARNNISGTYSAETLINVTEDISGGSITCNDAQVYGKFVECYGEIKKGSLKTIEIAFGDGSSEHVTQSKKFSKFIKKSCFLILYLPSKVMTESPQNRYRLQNGLGLNLVY